MKACINPVVKQSWSLSFMNSQCCFCLSQLQYHMYHLGWSKPPSLPTKEFHVHKHTDTLSLKSSMALLGKLYFLLHFFLLLTHSIDSFSFNMFSTSHYNNLSWVLKLSLETHDSVHSLSLLLSHPWSRYQLSFIINTVSLSHLFSSISSTHSFFFWAKYVIICSSSIRSWDSNPRPLEN